MTPQTLTRPQTQLSQAQRFPLKIEDAARHQMSIVAGMIRSSADIYAEFVSSDDLSEHYVDESWQEENYFKRNFYLGYSADDEAVGTLSLQYFDDYAYVGYLYLDTDFMGRGYGRRFLEFASQQARENGMKGLCLICHPQAPWAVKAYEKFGFRRYSNDREAILAWNNGALKNYFEEGFDLYLYHLPEEA